MSRRIRPLSVLLFLVDLLIVPVGLLAATRLRTTIPFGRGGALSPAVAEVPWPVYVLAVVCWGVAMAAGNAYSPERVLRWYNEALRVLAGSVGATILMAGLLYLSFREVSRLLFVYFFVVNVILMLGYRALLRVYYRLVGRRRPGGRDRVLIVGAGELGQEVARVLLDHSRWGFDPAGFLDDDPAKQGAELAGLKVLGRIDDLAQVVAARRIGEVWLVLPPRAYERTRQVVAVTETLPVRVKIVPDYFSMALVQARPEVWGGIPVIGLRESVISGFTRLSKRAFDLVVGALLLLPAAPLMALLAVLVRLDSPGPALLRQTRYGENGRLFQMLKFRTMIEDAEKRREEMLENAGEREVIHKRKDDPRVTRVGRFLRRYSLDELPQLLNVLRGEMSLVGPRPELPWLVDRYKPWQRKRFAVPQGITGWWQINGRSDRPMHLNTEDDLYYVYHYSLWLDIWILLRTPLAVLQGKGAF